MIEGWSKRKGSQNGPLTMGVARDSTRKELKWRDLKKMEDKDRALGGEKKNLKSGKTKGESE